MKPAPSWAVEDQERTAVKQKKLEVFEVLEV